MTRLSPAELRQLCIQNPDFAARNVEALKSLLSKPVAHETVECDLMRIHAPDLADWFIREYHFEKYRIDLADPQHALAIEVNGGRWLPGGGKHGKESDRRKIRRLTLAGWRVLEYSTEMVNDNPIGVIEEIRAALA